MIRTPSSRLWAGGLATVFLVAHLAVLPSTLEDIDSLNFALGLHHFDPAQHQPHPPGYPVFMALGKLARTIVPSDARALALLGAVFGALAVFPLLQLFAHLDAVEQRAPPDVRLGSLASLAVLATVASPLYWFNATRPLSDIPGLAVTLGAQAALAMAYARQRLDPSRSAEALESSGRMIVLGAFLSAVAIGFRSQAAVLTLPLLAIVLLQRAGRGAAGALLGSAMTFGLGVLLWAIPLVIATGGPHAYWSALMNQGGEDFSGVDMLYRNPTPRRLALGLLQTFIYPWASSTLGWIVFALAAIGMIVLIWRERRAAGLIAVLAGPYVVFHMLFQETVTTRYALPILPFIAFLAVRGVRAAQRASSKINVAAFATAVVVVWSLALTLPATRVYARDGSPAFQAIAELHRRLARQPDAVIGMHQGILRSVQTQNFAPVRILKAPPMREWLELTSYWKSGGAAPVWFLADPPRTDIELIDPLSRHLVAHYVWAFQRDDFMSGVRPDIVDLIKIDSPPGWFAEEGWHLTPETLNMSERLGKTEGVAYVRRRGGPALVVLGAQNLSDQPSTVDLRLDGKSVATYTLAPRAFVFNRLPLGPGSLSGRTPFAAVEASYAQPDGRPERVRLTQFAVEDPGEVFFVQQRGWNEIEYNRDLQRRWRWIEGKAETFINDGGRDVTVTLAGESPLKYFSTSPHVVVRAGNQVLATASPTQDFELRVPVPAAALQASDGILTVETDQTFVPHERSGSPDRRTLGLRLFEFDVR